MDREDLKQRAKVVDMMLTMHSVLADKYRLRAQVLEIATVAISTVLLALTFLDPAILRYLEIQETSARIAVGVCSVSVFVLSIVSLIVDWKGRARQHREAFNTLIPLKSEWRDFISSFDQYDARLKAEFSRKSALIVGNLVPIPDSQFNSLKARHQRKVVLSKLVSAYPGASIALLRVRLWLRRNRAVLASDLQEITKPESLLK
jgi:hypothetical protein